ncbi:hypothetical protein ACMHYO_16200 [Allopusillimonas ginsengisoli]|uniref:portal protein n=1 Tax=Allopusillimonas ginsengisoli TaxID=453575 RepID=UPI0039C494B6
MSAVTGFHILDAEAAGQVTHAHDKAPFDPAALKVTQLERWLDEIRNQPQWRREADRACDYYDGNQLSAEALQQRADKGLGELITNLIAPTVNAVLGMEAKTRTDWQVGADDDKYAEVADALSAKLHEAERETQADRANSDGYAAMIKAGFGAVEVSRESNPFLYPYRVAYIHRSELFWDWHSRKPDWSDARYVVRKKTFDADHIAAFFPKYAEIIRAAGNWRDWSDYLTLDARMSADLQYSLDQGLRTSWDDMDWRDVDRNRVTCFEVWYRVWVRGLVLRLPGGRVIEFNTKNRFHRAVVAAGAVQPHAAVYDKIRCAFYIGPIRVQDFATNRRRFPYIPFFGYREDLTGVPYGLIRSMMSPQDEINARAAKMMWLLNARRVQADSDALDERFNTMSDASRELARADAFVVTNPSRQNKVNAIRVDENMQLSQQQFQIMQERKAAIQEAAGVYAAMMGQQTNASSGLAIQSLVEQGVTTLAEINDNYRLSRRHVGEALLELIKEDMTDQAEILVDTGLAKRRVAVNIPKRDPVTGQQYKENDVQTAPVKVALSDVPSTSTYRQQQFGQFAEILKSMPPQYQALLIPFALEMSDFSRRKEMAEFLRKQLGIVADPNSPEAQAADKAAQSANAQARELETNKAQAEIAEKMARAEKLQAETQALLNRQESDDSRTQLQKAHIQQETELKKAQIKEEGANQRHAKTAAAERKVQAFAADLAQLVDEINQS